MIRTICAGLACALISAAVRAEHPAEEKLSWGGDLRFGFYSLHRDDRDRSEDATDEVRARVRVGVNAKWPGRWEVKARLAGRYSTHENDNHFALFTSAPSGDGLRAGDSTIDELYVAHSPAQPWRVRVGRLQTKFELEGVAKKSLDRSDSPNVDITWTDGAHVIYRGGGGWRTHVILQYNDPGGATNVRREPLDFTDDGSRVTYFVGLENTQPLGPIVQRGLDVTYLPASLRKDGTPDGRVEDYWGLVGRLAARWPTPRQGMKFMMGAELGYAPSTPTEAAIETGGAADTGGLALVGSLSLVDIVPEHSLGLVYGRVEGGWLLSPDFRNNNTLVELRYRWAIDKYRRVEVRVRRREDIEQLNGTLRRRMDTDLYARFTYKF